ncbi:magnesium transporter [Candidatus Woesearchaeota archaeon]|nr:magnesium transporter [Candidatus Woesearchaeota archaeon]
MIQKIKNHKTLKKNINFLTKIEREKHHPLLHHIHKKLGISRKTIFYIKEYGPRSHVADVIIKESIFILILTSFLSAFGGIALENMKDIFIAILPFVILYPALNNMVGSYGSVISSKFGTMLLEGKIKSSWWKNAELRKLFSQIMIIAVVTGSIGAAASLILAGFSDYVVTSKIAIKIFGIVLLDVIILVGILFALSIFAGEHYFKKQEDPNNFLIPITTSVGDLGNGLILAFLIALLF